MSTNKERRKVPIGIWFWVIFHYINFISIFVLAMIMAFTHTNVLAEYYNISPILSIIGTIFILLVSAIIIVGFHIRSLFSLYISYVYIFVSVTTNVLQFATLTLANVVFVIIMLLTATYLFKNRVYFSEFN